MSPNRSSFSSTSFIAACAAAEFPAAARMAALLRVPLIAWPRERNAAVGRAASSEFPDAGRGGESSRKYITVRPVGRRATTDTVPCYIATTRHATSRRSSLCLDRRARLRPRPRSDRGTDCRLGLIKDKRECKDPTLARFLSSTVPRECTNIPPKQTHTYSYM